MTNHFFFDLDDTLTKSRSPIDPTHEPIFERLCAEKDVIVVSGAQESQMRKQLPDLARVKYFMLTQNGNHAIGPDGSVLWSESFSDDQKKVIFDRIESWKKELAIPVRDVNDLIEDRGSQISYSLIGHEEDRAKKAAFDPGGAMRKDFLAHHADDVDHLRQANVEVTIGGTTCFDIFLLGRNKGYNVARLTEQMGWDKEECVYVGDALEPGRNDETVIGVLPTHAIRDPNETFAFISEMLS